MTMWETDARAADGTGDGPGGGGTGGVVIHSPGELAASVPALLGFVPGADSVVAMCARTDERWTACGRRRRRPAVTRHTWTAPRRWPMT